MISEPTPPEKARRLVDLYLRNIICGGEVWGQLIEFVTSENAEACLSILPDDLRIHLQRLTFGEPDEESSIAPQRHGLSAMKIWFINNESL